MTDVLATVTAVLVLVLATWAVPWLAIHALVPTLESSKTGVVSNYRGRPVALGLGIVWVVWVVGLQIVALLDYVYVGRVSADQAPLVFGSDIFPYPLVLGAFALGLVDDVFGTGDDKGFRGHLGALARGRLTTGGLKLVGIGLLSLLAVVPDVTSGSVGDVQGIGVWLLQGAGIALTANLVNLTDLRPGRALKCYSVLVIAGSVLIGLGWDWAMALYFGIALVGPVLAVWSFDLGERAMLGDGGANAAGALAGWVLVMALQQWWWALAAYVAVVLVLNVVSERVSFSAVIEGNGALRWLDGLGRLAPSTGDDAGSKAARPAKKDKTRPHGEGHDR